MCERVGRKLGHVRGDSWEAFAWSGKGWSPGTSNGGNGVVLVGCYCSCCSLCYCLEACRYCGDKFTGSITKRRGWMPAASWRSHGMPLTAVPPARALNMCSNLQLKLALLSPMDGFLRHLLLRCSVPLLRWIRSWQLLDSLASGTGYHETNNSGSAVHSVKQH